MKPTIVFCDLAHRGHSCNAMPYAISLVLAYALKQLGSDTFNYEMFKHPDDLNAYLDAGVPEVVCFSNYIWNADLSLAIAKRIKAHSPKTVIIFGGPNYSIVPTEQEAYLRLHSEIDFYIFRDGEIPFVELLRALFQRDLNADVIKKERLSLPSCHYVADGAFVAGALASVLPELDDVPSPYLTGLMDPFFEMNLVPLTQTTRGCPFKCTYCQDGHEYSNKVKRHSTAFITEELEYIAARTRAPNLQWADLNFGMYKQDLETCRTIARLREKYGWPHSVELNGKNQKERILEAARIIDGPELDGGAIIVTAAVQSTDMDVLSAVKRENISIEATIGVAKEGKSMNANSFSEVILCLPGDTKEAHFRSLDDLMDAGINVVRSHQFIMLNGSEAATPLDRKVFDMSTRFRVTPRTVAFYKLFGEEFAAPEIDEICVGNNTMSFDDYLECRKMNLTVEIFYNYGLFRELLGYMRARGISIPPFIRAIHEHITSTKNPLNEVYEGFIRETHEIWNSRKEIEAFLKEPGVIAKYQNGEMGNNEQLMYRALAIFNHMADLHHTAFALAKKNLDNAGLLDEKAKQYLEELEQFSQLRKQDILSTDQILHREFHYDFPALDGALYELDPRDHHRPNGVIIKFSHSDTQKKMISQYVDLFGLETYGLGNILGSQTSVNNFYRAFEVV